MAELGKMQVMRIVRFEKQGAYLTDGTLAPREQILLPGKEIPEGAETGDSLEVFLYRDSEDRMTASVQRPLLTVGETAVLTVSEVNAIGAFLDWGMAKELLLPYHEQTAAVKAGQKVAAALYVDRSGRLCATMKVQPYLRSDSPYRVNDEVEGIVYQNRRGVGALVAVDGKYFGLIPEQELVRRLPVAETVHARVSRVREDGKLDLSLRRRAHEMIDVDAARLMESLEHAGGFLPCHDRSDPAQIRRLLSMSKAEFKRAAGRLYRDGRIRFTEGGIEAADRDGAKPGDRTGKDRLRKQQKQKGRDYDADR